MADLQQEQRLPSTEPAELRARQQQPPIESTYDVRMHGKDPSVPPVDRMPLSELNPAQYIQSTELEFSETEAPGTQPELGNGNSKNLEAAVSAALDEQCQLAAAKAEKAAAKAEASAAAQALKAQKAEAAAAAKAAKAAAMEEAKARKEAATAAAKAAKAAKAAAMEEAKAQKAAAREAAKAEKAQKAAATEKAEKATGVKRPRTEDPPMTEYEVQRLNQIKCKVTPPLPFPVKLALTE